MVAWNGTYYISTLKLLSKETLIPTGVHLISYHDVCKEVELLGQEFHG